MWGKSTVSYPDVGQIPSTPAAKDLSVSSLLVTWFEHVIGVYYVSREYILWQSMCKLHYSVLTFHGGGLYFYQVEVILLSEGVVLWRYVICHAVMEEAWIQ